MMYREKKVVPREITSKYNKFQINYTLHTSEATSAFHSYSADYSYRCHRHYPVFLSNLQYLSAYASKVTPRAL